jgi:hypothetical protein
MGKTYRSNKKRFDDDYDDRGSSKRQQIKRAKELRSIRNTSHDYKEGFGYEQWENVASSTRAAFAPDWDD